MNGVVLIGSILGFWVTRFYLLFVFPLLCIASFLCYGLDKWLARQEKSQIPEATLHMIDAFGGWPGGFLGQYLFRHKKQKMSYRIRFWLLSGFHLACCYVVYRAFHG